MPYDTQIVRVSTGFLNTVNDAVCGGSGLPGLSKFNGQLGKAIWVDSGQIATLFTPAPPDLLDEDYLTVLYAGGYRYVQFDPESDGETSAGRLMYWDNNADPSRFIVTRQQDTTELNYASIAGFLVSPLVPGHFGWIQFAGIAQCAYVGEIGGDKISGATVVASTDSDGHIDIINDLATTDGARLLQNFIGWAVSVPEDEEVGVIEIARAFTTRM